jgi:hypothetical protein
MANFYHSGATGDVIYSLPTIQALGGGTLHLVLPDHLYDVVKPLIEVQDYIHEVKKGREFIPPIYDLDLFRNNRDLHLTHLVELHLQTFGIKGDVWKNGWLKVEPIISNNSFINITPRYVNPNTDWIKEINFLKDNSENVYFIGLESEYEPYKHLIERYVIKDYLELAQLQLGARYVSGNQSSFMAVAQGLGINYRMSQAPDHTNCNQFLPKETLI